MSMNVFAFDCRNGVTYVGRREEIDDMRAEATTHARVCEEIFETRGVKAKNYVKLMEYIGIMTSEIYREAGQIQKSQTDEIKRVYLHHIQNKFTNHRKIILRLDDIVSEYDVGGLSCDSSKFEY